VSQHASDRTEMCASFLKGRAFLISNIST
jgi:hypothetical protein